MVMATPICANDAVDRHNTTSANSSAVRKERIFMVISSGPSFLVCPVLLNGYGLRELRGEIACWQRSSLIQSQPPVQGLTANHTASPVRFRSRLQVLRTGPAAR